MLTTFRPVVTTYEWLDGRLAVLARHVHRDRRPGAGGGRRAGGDTLSEHVWKWFAIKGKPTGYKMRRFVLLAFWAWLTIHFFTGGWV